MDLVQQFGGKGSKIPHSNLAPDRAKGKQSRIGGRNYLTTIELWKPEYLVQS
jgi:hypothetical protein